MRRALIALAVAGATTTAAQESPAGKSIKIGVIDMDRVRAESQLGKAYSAKFQALQNEIDTARAAKQGTLEKMDAEIKALEDDLEKQAALLSQEGADKKRQAIKKKTRDRQDFLEEGTAEVDRMKQRAQSQADAWTAELQRRMTPHVQTVATRAGLDLLLDARNAMPINTGLDISPAVIAEIDQTEKLPTASATTTEKPAAAPAPDKRTTAKQ